MKYVLDTHAFLWWVTDDADLSETARELISDHDRDVLFSTVSAWEIVIKHAIGRLVLEHPPKRFLRDQLSKTGFPVLAVSLEHALEVSDLPAIHSDPFDRLLAAQCRCEDAVLVSRDTIFARYPIDHIW